MRWFDVDKVAAHLDVSNDAVRSLTKRAIGQLRGALGHDDLALEEARGAN